MTCRPLSGDDVQALERRQPQLRQLQQMGERLSQELVHLVVIHLASFLVFLKIVVELVRSSKRAEAGEAAEAAGQGPEPAVVDAQVAQGGAERRQRGVAPRVGHTVQRQALQAREGGQLYRERRDAAVSAWHASKARSSRASTLAHLPRHPLRRWRHVSNSFDFQIGQRQGEICFVGDVDIKPC